MEIELPASVTAMSTASSEVTRTQWASTESGADGRDKVRCSTSIGRPPTVTRISPSIAASGGAGKTCGLPPANVTDNRENSTQCKAGSRSVIGKGIVTGITLSILQKTTHFVDAALCLGSRETRARFYESESTPASLKSSRIPLRGGNSSPLNYRTTTRPYH